MNINDEAIQIMVKHIVEAVKYQISQAPFDKIVEGIITSVENSTYTVTINGGVYDITDVNEYNINEKVRVVIPQNDADKMFILPQVGSGGGVSADAMLKSLFATNSKSSNGYVDKSIIADKLTTARNISLVGDVTGTAQFDGSSNVTITTSANSVEQGDCSKILNLSTPPLSPTKGQVYYNTSSNKFYGYNNSSWVDLGQYFTNGTILSAITASFTTEEKNKLLAIAANATKTENSVTNGNIKINDTETTVYTHPSSDGSMHIPANGTENNGKVLKAGSTAGSYSWGTLSKSDIGLGNVDNTSDINKPVSTAVQTELDGKISNTSNVISNSLLADMDVNTIKGRRSSGTGDPENLTVSQVKTMLSINNITNTSDANKPVSTATQTALDLKANISSPTLTGTPKAPTANKGTNSTQIATTAFVQSALSGSGGGDMMKSVYATNSKAEQGYVDNAINADKVGSSTKEEIISSALTQIRDGASTNYNTLKKLETAILSTGGGGADLTNINHTSSTIQGGDTGEYYHLTEDEKDKIPDIDKVKSEVFPSFYYGEATKISDVYGKHWQVNIPGIEMLYNGLNIVIKFPEPLSEWNTHYLTINELDEQELEIGWSIGTDEYVAIRCIVERYKTFFGAYYPLASLDLSHLWFLQCDMWYALDRINYKILPDIKDLYEYYDELEDDIGGLMDDHLSASNPHGITKSDVGLSNVTNDKQMPISNGVLENYREKLVTLSVTSNAINLSLGNVFTHTLTGNTTYSITTAVNGQAHSFTLIIIQTVTVRTLTFPASVKWQGGEIPDMTTPLKEYELFFTTTNGGGSWRAGLGGVY